MLGFDGRPKTDSMCGRRFVTGLRGVVVRLLRLLRRSRREEEDTVRLTEVSTFRTSIFNGNVQDTASAASGGSAWARY